jgi:chromosomal replication initiator protein
LKLLADDGDELLVGAPGQFHRDWIADNHKAFLAERVAETFGELRAIKLVALPAAEKPRESRPAIEVLTTEKRELIRPRPLSLRSEFNFDNFIVGVSNQFAHAASRAVADKPALRYNPLFLFGGVGLGKTHLVQAVANATLEKNPSARIIYSSAEQFMVQFVNATQHHGMEDFRRRHRAECDMLIIDDIQFIAGKDLTQEEFFHTFNALYEARRQIVITSDKPPVEIANLEERLRSRFQCGLIADIRPPEFETRVAILKKKAEEAKLGLPDDVAMFVAGQVRSNVRDLEGSLTTLSAHAALLNKNLDLHLAVEIFKNLSYGGEVRHSFESIMREVALYFDLKIPDLKSERRHQSVARPRQIAMYLCRKFLHASYPEIGRQFGDKDHTTVISACRRIEHLAEKDAAIKSALEILEKNLKP